MTSLDRRHGWNTACGLAADLQLAAALPRCEFVEYITQDGGSYVDDLVVGGFALDKDGMLTIPDGPGLGVTWSIEGIRKHTGMDVSPTVNALQVAAKL